MPDHPDRRRWRGPDDPAYDPTKRRYDEFYCRCHDTGRAHIEAMRQRVEDAWPSVDDAQELLHVTALSLCVDYDAPIEIAADQWFAVSATNPQLWAVIQADELTDGLLGLWDAFRQHATGSGDIWPGDDHQN